MGTSLWNIGTSGLKAAQLAIATTGNNITNANVEGYSRQRVDFNTQTEQFTGSGYVGSGVIATGIGRVVEQFLVNQLRADTANFHSINATASFYEQLDGLLADTSTGVSPTIQQLFASLQQAAQDPTSISVRQVVLNDAGTLVQRFNELYTRLESQQSVANQQLDAMTTQVNGLANGIASLNQQIQQLVAGTGSQPNALLDQRDEMLRQLSELVGVSVVPDNSGQVNVFIGNGQPLVVGNRANSIATVASPEDAAYREIVFKADTTSSPISQFISGGSIGGIMNYRDEALIPTMNELGRIALSFSHAINEQQKMGLDLDGNFGKSLFTDINSATAMASRALPASTNQGTAQLQVALTDMTALTGADYRLTFTSATDYQLLNAKGQELTPPVTGSVTALPATITTPEGFDITLNGTVAMGDTFRIQPTRTAAQDIGIALSKPRELAFGAPITTDTHLRNTGTGQISAGKVLNAYTADGDLQSTFATANTLSPPLSVRFTTVNSYEIFDNTDPTNPQAFVPPLIGTITPGQKNTITINDPVSGDAVYQFDISGYPAAGDSFSLGYNLNGSSDNRNAVALGDLRLSDQVGGNLTVEEAYGAMVAKVGARTAELKIHRDASDSLLNQAQANRDSVSGVNLDEEAANLIRFEQAYNASAQVISIARSLFDSLLSAVR